MGQTICRWGILGTAGIARKNWLAIRNAENCTLTGVASRDPQRCISFIAECQRHAPFDPPPRAFASYEELLASDTVDAVLFFSEGVSAGLYCSFLAENQQWANVSGTKGFIYVPDFVLPHYGNEIAFEVSNAVFHVAGCDFKMEDHRRRVAVDEGSNSAPNSQEANMFRNFAATVHSSRLDGSWGEMALKTQAVLDACLQSAEADGRLVEVDSTR